MFDICLNKLLLSIAHILYTVVIDSIRISFSRGVIYERHVTKRVIKVYAMGLIRRRGMPVYAYMNVYK